MGKAKHGGKAAFDKAWGAFEKLGGPVNKLTNKIGSEAFWPTTLDKESDKCARILKSFCSKSLWLSRFLVLTPEQKMAFIPSSQQLQQEQRLMGPNRGPRSW